MVELAFSLFSLVLETSLLVVFVKVLVIGFKRDRAVGSKKFS